MKYIDAFSWWKTCGKQTEIKPGRQFYVSILEDGAPTDQHCKHFPNIISSISKEKSLTIFWKEKDKYDYTFYTAISEYEPFPVLRAFAEHTFVW